jgi:hypothetical protein
MAASFNSHAILVQDAKCLAVELYSAASGDRAGTINIQKSNSGLWWESIQFNDSTLATDTDLPVTASTVFTKVIDIDGLGAKFIRIVFTSSAGTTGTLDCYVNRKVS